MGITQTQPFGRPITSLPMQPPPAAAAAPNDPFTSQGGEKKKRVEKESGRAFNLIDQLLSGLGALDAFGNNLAARRDPTGPALMNSALGTYANFMNAGGVNPNAALAGDFSGMNFMQPVSFGGDAASPFNIPIQRPGGNPMTEALFNQLVGPAGASNIAAIAQSLLGFGSPNTNRTTATGPSDIAALYQALGLPPTPVPNSPVLDSYATGTPFVPQTGNYKLHQGEAVIPAQQNPANNGMMIAPVDTFAYGKSPRPVGTPATPPTAAPTTVPPAAPPPSGPIYGGTPHLTPPTAPATPPPAPTPYAPAAPSTGAPANPLQAALQQLQQLMGSGGPINQNVQNIQNQQIADTISRGQQQQMQDMRANFGARGLGGSGLQYGMEQALNDASLRALTEGQNQVALNAASQNFNALQNVANSLVGGSLGAGQFGLQQAQFNLGQQQSMLEQLMNLLRQSYAPVNTPTPAPAAA